MQALTGHGEVEDSPLLEEDDKNQPFMIVLRTEMGQMAVSVTASRPTSRFTIGNLHCLR